MLLLFNESERLECAKVVVLKLGAILCYSGIHNYEKKAELSTYPRFETEAWGNSETA